MGHSACTPGHVSQEILPAGAWWQHDPYTYHHRSHATAATCCASTPVHACMHQRCAPVAASASTRNSWPLALALSLSRKECHTVSSSPPGPSLPGNTPWCICMEAHGHVCVASCFSSPCSNAHGCVTPAPPLPRAMHQCMHASPRLTPPSCRTWCCCVPGLYHSARLPVASSSLSGLSATAAGTGSRSQQCRQKG